MNMIYFVDGEKGKLVLLFEGNEYKTLPPEQKKEIRQNFTKSGGRFISKASYPFLWRAEAAAMEAGAEKLSKQVNF